MHRGFECLGRCVRAPLLIYCPNIIDARVMNTDEWELQVRRDARPDVLRAHARDTGELDLRQAPKLATQEKQCPFLVLQAHGPDVADVPEERSALDNLVEATIQ